MSFDRIATLTLNPAIDLSLHTDTLRHESLNRVLSEREEAGGKGVNVSRLLSRLDVPNHAVALCGLENLPHYQSLLPDEVDFRPPARTARLSNSTAPAPFPPETPSPG